LRLVLFALARQNTDDFEVIVADDGSSKATKTIIEKFKKKVNYKINHVWQQHKGFRAAMIRNKAVAGAQGKYLVFLDGDSIPQTSFINYHKKLSEKNYFVSGNRILLSANFTKHVLAQQLPVQNWKWWHWLYAFCHGWINRFLPLVFLGNLYWRYAYKTKWQGAKTCNLGMWKKDFLAVNGFDENYHGWGYEDSDLVVRLIRKGISRKDGRFMLSVLHLWHPQNSRNNEQNNYQKLEKTLHSSHIKAKLGVNQYIHH
jgi:glycosyltransferase involved in cell wall biosynthesis